CSCCSTAARCWGVTLMPMAVLLGCRAGHPGARVPPAYLLPSEFTSVYLAPGGSQQEYTRPLLFDRRLVAGVCAALAAGTAHHGPAAAAPGDPPPSPRAHDARCRL